MKPARLLSLLVATGLSVTCAAQNAAKDDPRYFGGIWESERFFFLINNTPKLPKTQQMVDRYAAAMKSGQILYTAWTSCRPGAISAMAMVMNSIVVLQTGKDITISLEEPRMTRRIRLDSAYPKTWSRATSVTR